ncbi:MAG: carbohydrate ABC transporter permease [Sphaerochaetaceae bacterium]|nr:carbohydrate ABC transporter permease [Sphaerochaetaceae bacterium]MDD3163300.1 carbohydrate ABC transporter permease [Sphaerochaetaceae bacterium]MDD4006568.1 carbohydrate ABC transporter permease [Sphaerochaetaceae bacterium]MDD4397467.1 carbohydrate ABC transporter permease [Sphaerochaetaceae bacterium]
MAMNRYIGKVTVGEVISWIVLIVVLLFCLLPIAFMLSASFMDAKQIMAMPFDWLPKKSFFTSEGRTFLTNFSKAIHGNNNNNMFFRNLFNSLLVAISCSITTVLLASLCGYGLAKFRFRGRNFVFMSIMATMMIPFEAIMIPLYMVASMFKMMNTYAGLIVPFLVSAFGVFQMRQYLITFPAEYLDASRVDGLGEFPIYWRIVLPNCTPVVATLGILSFRNQWDNLLWPLLVSQREEMKTIPQYISKFSEEKQTDEGALMACALLASIPMFILFFTLSKYFLGGAAVFESRKG